MEDQSHMKQDTRLAPYSLYNRSRSGKINRARCSDRRKDTHVMAVAHEALRNAVPAVDLRPICWDHELVQLAAFAVMLALKC
jgi:hypothetical protein